MFELTIIQKKNSYSVDEIVLFFKSEDAEEMFDLIEMMVKATRNEMEYTIRVLEKGAVEDEE